MGFQNKGETRWNSWTLKGQVSSQRILPNGWFRFIETFSSLVKLTTFWTFLTIALSHALSICQLGVNCASWWGIYGSTS